MPSLNEILKEEKKDSKQESKQEKKTGNVAAAKMLEAHSVKDRRITVRLTSATYERLQAINQKRGTNTNSIVNQLISDYILQYQHYLEDEM